MQLQAKTVLNDIQPFMGFVYQDVRGVRNRQGLSLNTEAEAQDW